MPKRTKPEPKPTPRERPQPSPAVEERDVGRSEPVAAGDVLVPPFAGSADACRICGTIRTTDVCPVDGFRFGGDA